MQDVLAAIGLHVAPSACNLALVLAVLCCFGATFTSRIAIEGDLAAGALAIARVEGLEPARDVQLARATGRAETRVAQEFVRFARERLA